MRFPKSASLEEARTKSAYVRKHWRDSLLCGSPAGSFPDHTMFLCYLFFSAFQPSHVSVLLPSCCRLARGADDANQEKRRPPTDLREISVQLRDRHAQVRLPGEVPHGIHGLPPPVHRLPEVHELLRVELFSHALHLEVRVHEPVRVGGRQISSLFCSVSI